MRRLIALALTGPSFVDALRHAWDAGDAILPVDLRLPSAMQQQLLQIMGAAAIVDDTGTHEFANARPVEDGDALVIATSGTTGEPKGVVHTHDSIAASAIRTSEALEVTTNDHWLACLPLAHIGGLSVVMRALHTNTPLTVLPQFDADTVAQAARNGATLTSLVLAAYRRINPLLFRKIVLGGATPPEEVAPNTLSSYGMTETGSGIVYDKTPLRDVQLRINARGEIEVQSPTLLRCYRDGTDPKVDGWFATGDAGSLDDGVLKVHGRINEVINTGGEKVWPATVEGVLKTHPAINEALVFGKPDPEWGQAVVARVETTNDIQLDELREFVKAHLPAFAAPKRIERVTELPRTSSGKLRRP